MNEQRETIEFNGEQFTREGLEAILTELRKDEATILMLLEKDQYDKESQV